jgi:hypothetical protein
MAGFCSRLSSFKKFEEKDREMHPLSSKAYRFAKLLHFPEISVEKTVLNDLLRASVKTSRELQQCEERLAIKFMQIAFCFSISLGSLSRRKVRRPEFHRRAPRKSSPQQQIENIIAAVTPFQKMLEKWIAALGDGHVFCEELKNYEYHCLGLILNLNYVHDHILGNFERAKFFSNEQARARKREICRRFLEEEVKIFF